jgi:hypothetical protein
MKVYVITLFSLLIIGLSSCAQRVASPSTNRVVIKNRPTVYKVVKVKGKRYYFWNGNHYRKTKNGYVLVRFYDN